MAFKLKNLKVKKVDFVDEGANPDAHIRLFKRKDETENKETQAGEPVTKDVGLARKFISFFSDLLGFDEDDVVTEDDLTEAVTAAKAKRDNMQSTEPDNQPETGTNKSLEKGVEDMKFNKSKMTPEELKTLEELEKKYGVVKSDDEEPDDAEGAEGTEDVSLDEEAEDTVISDEEAETSADETEEVDKKKDVYKGLHPEVAAEIEELKKYKEKAEEKELLEVAKKYEILGKKPEELVKKFKTLKAAGGTAYDDMISVLDESVTFAEKSGLFSEIGKSGHGDLSGSAEATARAKAVELMKSKSDLTMAQAIDEVLTNDPELRARYEEED